LGRGQERAGHLGAKKGRPWRKLGSKGATAMGELSLEEQREEAWARRSELRQGEQRSWTRRGKDAMGGSRQPFLEQRNSSAHREELWRGSPRLGKGASRRAARRGKLARARERAEELGELRQKREAEEQGRGAWLRAEDGHRWDFYPGWPSGWERGNGGEKNLEQSGGCEDKHGHRRIDFCSQQPERMRTTG
jgi:hypothetical protein